MIAACLYVLFCAAVIPCWIVQQHLGGRSIPFILSTCGYILYLLIAGINIPMDTITLIAGCIAVWLFMSLTWTDTAQSKFEIYNLLSCLVLFIAARTIPLVITALIVFSVGVSFAAVEITRIIKTRKFPAVDALVSFGNGNHTGAFMLVSLFVGVWLTNNLSLWFIPFVLLVAFVLIISRCKGAIIGYIVAGIATLYLVGLWQISSLILLVVVAYVLRRFGTIPNARTSIGGRIWLYFASIEMIIKKPLTGWGLNSYRKELPDIDAKISKSKLYEVIGKKINADMNTCSHRVHNDHLEIMAEIGIPGYALYVYLFSSITYDPIIFGLLIAFLIHACFFFPFREVHTAAPFWVIMGSMAGGTISTIAIPLFVKILIACMLIAVIYQTLHKFLGQWYSEMARNRKGITEKQKLEYIEIAVAHDPYNGGYLSDAAFYYSKVDTIQAFLYASRCLFHYDGKRVKHGIWDLYARTLIAVNKIELCKFAEDCALWLKPDFPAAHTIKKFLFMQEAANTKAGKKP
jgi:O-antigen ligase